VESLQWEQGEGNGQLLPRKGGDCLLKSLHDCTLIREVGTFYLGKWKLTSYSST